MKTDYITPETASNQNPTRKNEGHNYGKGSPEEQSEDVDPRNETPGKQQEQEPERDNDQPDHQEETGPATPPEKTREAPQANPQA